jgi:hypothetical protein
MDKVAWKLVCSSPDCPSTGVVKDLEIHAGHRDFIMPVGKLIHKINSSKPKRKTLD